MATRLFPIVSLIDLLLMSVKADENASHMLCRTPNNESAYCISLYSCPILLKALGTLQPLSLEFVRQSQCGIQNDFLVCCGNFSTFINDQKHESASFSLKKISSSKNNEPPLWIWTGAHRQNVSDYLHRASLLPDIECCGISDETIGFNNNDEKIMPWIALLKGQSQDEKNFIACSGTLISRRYILTVVECLSSNITVLLGKLSLGGNDAEYTPNALEVYIEEKYIHPKYDLTLNEYNIALLRLSHDVEFSDYVKPICLSSGSHKSRTEDKEVVISGRITSEGNYLAFKEKVKHVLISNENCQQTYEHIQINNDSSLCIKGVERDTKFCFEDIGGPIMYSYKNRWFLKGVVSLGGSCNLELPIVGIKIDKFMEWILENIRE